ncbi:MAG: hypothetical protein ACTSSH_03050, partial [Candidatus Heimdallarchaeota archaeon]
MSKNRKLSTRVWAEKIPEERQNNMHRFIVKICEEAGPREPGSEAEHKAANIVKEEFEKHCDKVEKE